MTDGCPCPLHVPVSLTGSSQGRIRAAPAELSPLVCCFLVALAPHHHHPLSHPAPSESILTPAKYTLVTGRPSLRSHWTTTITGFDLLCSLLLIPFPSFFLFFFSRLLRACSSHLALLAIHILIPCSALACTCSTLSGHKIYIIISYCTALYCKKPRIFVTWLSQCALPLTLYNNATFTHATVPSSKSSSCPWRACMSSPLLSCPSHPIPAPSCPVLSL